MQIHSLFYVEPVLEVSVPLKHPLLKLLQLEFHPIRVLCYLRHLKPEVNVMHQYIVVRNDEVLFARIDKVVQLYLKRES